MPMHTKKLILLLLAILWLVPVRADDVPGRDAELSVSTDVQRPEWVDLGLCDVLAVGGSTSVAAPTTVRLVHDTPSACVPSVSACHTLFARQAVKAICARPCIHRSYLYMLRCLRL